jgi:hypothetical protein
MPLTKFLNVQSMAGWETVVGPSISPNVPSAFAFANGPTAPFGLPNTALITGTGVKGKFSGFMCKGPSLSFTFPAGVTTLIARKRFTLDANSLVNCQALEIGFKAVDSKARTYNWDIQCDYSESATDMQIEVVTAAGAWSASIGSMPKFAANVEHELNQYLSLNTTTGVSSVNAIEIDGNLFLTPASLLNLPALSLGWAPNEIVDEVQPDYNELGGAFQWLLTNSEIIVG